MSALFYVGAYSEALVAAELDTERADEVALYSLCPEDGLPVFTGVVLPAEKPAGICFYEGDL